MFRSAKGELEEPAAPPLPLGNLEPSLRGQAVSRFSPARKGSVRFPCKEKIQDFPFPRAKDLVTHSGCACLVVSKVQPQSQTRQTASLALHRGSSYLTTDNAPLKKGGLKAVQRNFSAPAERVRSSHGPQDSRKREGCNSPK